MKFFFFEVQEKVQKKPKSWNWQNGDKNIFCPFFKFSLNFRAHALQSQLHKVSVSNFVKI